MEKTNIAYQWGVAMGWRYHSRFNFRIRQPCKTSELE